MTGRRLLLLFTLLAIPVGGTACRGVLPGDRCTDSTDCDPPLVCSNELAPPGTRGVCVRPEAVPDAAPTEDASP